MRCVNVEPIEWEDDLHDLEIEGGDGCFVVEGVVAHNSNFRVGFHGSRPYMVGTHTSRVADTRLDASTWPEGHLVRKALEWCHRVGMQARIARFRAENPSVQSLSIFGEVCGWKCSDLHYGCTSDSLPEVRLFAEVCLNGTWLDYADALAVCIRMFDDLPTADDIDAMFVPVLYRGKPDAAVLKRLRDQPSALAASRGVSQISEGVVVRPTKEAFSKATLGRLIGKYKSPLYEERRTLRSKDPEQLPVYMSAYDLLFDFVTDERILHVLNKAEASGVRIAESNMNQLIPLLYQDIRKESVGEWPGGEAPMDETLLLRWTRDIAGDSFARVIQDRAKGAY